MKLFSQFDQFIEERTTLYVFFYLAFVVFLRMSEFTYFIKNLENEEFNKWFLIRRSMRLYDDYLKLTLSVSKTDSFRQEITLTIAVIDDDACLVRALKHLFRK